MNQARGRPPHDDLLTPMEWTTVEWVRHGLTNRQIAERRGVSADAVKFHVANVLGKLGLASGDRGVEFVSAPHMIHRHEDGTEEWMAFFNDPEGRPLALMARAKPS